VPKHDSQFIKEMEHAKHSNKRSPIMKRNTQSATRNLGRSILALAATMLAALSAHAATLYWDTNGATTEGAGTTPTGTWVTGGTSWNTGADGDVASDTWANNDSPVFSAGTDATEATITVQGTIYTGSIHFDEGSYTMVGSSSPDLQIIGGSDLTVDSDASVIFDSSLPVKLINSGARTWTIFGEARVEGTVTAWWQGINPFRKSGTGTLVFDGDVGTSSGGVFNQVEANGGTMIVNGSWTGIERFFVWGNLGGNGTISTSQQLSINGNGTINPGDSTGDRIGTLNVTGSGPLYLSNVMAGGSVNLEVGTTADKLDVTGAFNVSNTSTANVTNLGGITITQDSSYTVIEAGSTSGMNNLTVDAAAPWTATKTATGLEIALDSGQDRGDLTYDPATITALDLGTDQASGYIDLYNMLPNRTYSLYLDIVGGTLSNLTDQLTLDGVTWSSGTGDYELMISLSSGTTTHEYLVWDFSDIDGDMELGGVALIPEPASFVLLSLGVLALMRRPRRRRTA
jgi:hypothetical protein